MMTKISLIFTILMLLAVKADGQPCRFGRSGAGCRYNCNCAGNCDNQTGCAGNCAAGWDGPTCQRRNVALHQMTYQSSDYSDKNQFKYTSKFAVDGKVGHTLESTPCTHTKSGSRGWWRVTLNRTYSIYTFQIYNRVGSCNDGKGPKSCGRGLNGFTLSVGTNNQSYSTCYTDTTTTNKGPGVTINGRCNDSKPRSGNTVQISLPLESSIRLTLCEVRLFVCSEGWYGEMCDKECVTDTRCYQCDGDGLWCEKCVNGRWGTDCGEECGHCWNNTACDKDTSECPNLSHRCESGFQGYNCTTNCSLYTWGPDCKGTCGQCHGGTVCDGVSGDCPLENPRCAIGYTGPRCEPCPGGTFGDQCQEECGQCKDESHTCDHVNGTCTSCADGWLGDLCKEACPGGTFGDQCQEKCGQCKDGNLTCDHVNGTCTSCAERWLGDLCKQEATLLDGSNIEMSVGGIAGGVSGGVVLLLVMVVVFLIIRRSRRQPGQSQGTAISAVSTSVSQHVPHSEVPNRTQEPGTDPATYYNMAASEEHPYETVPEKEYDKLRFSRRENDTIYTSLT